MGTLYIQEYEGMSRDLTGVMVPVGKEPALASQTVTTSSGASNQSAALQASTRFVRIVASDDVHLAFGEDPVATTSDLAMEASQAEYFGVREGAELKVAAIEGAL